ncbi:MAG: 23S rRNA (adenine(2030)-N(6))-methyltransferase RlmJ [Alphaproteobacteria bacterium]
MNYQHQYHFGNFADIVKHCILIFCLEKLQEKPSSFLAIDTHASSGKFKVNDERILKTNEFKEGLQKIFSHQNYQHILPLKYLEILAKINICKIEELTDKLRFYAGSPLIIKNFLRNDDKAIFAESQNLIFNELRRNFAGNKKILCLNENGFNLTKSKLPAHQSRALVLIDPAYEKNQNKISEDYDLAINSLQQGHKRCGNGIFLLWHPIIQGEESFLQNFYQKILNLKFQNIHHLTFDIAEFSENKNKMHQCGMFIFNMPWGLDEKINLYFPKILEILKNSNKSKFDLVKLKGE